MIALLYILLMLSIGFFGFIFFFVAFYYLFYKLLGLLGDGSHPEPLRDPNWHTDEEG